MANKVKILDKIARNLNMLKISNTRGATSVVVENGSNDLTISYVDASIDKPMGGIDGNVSPFLGIGIANPGKLKLEGAGVTTANPATVGELIDSLTAARVLHLISGFANNITLANANAGAGADLDVELEGHQDLLMMGQ